MLERIDCQAARELMDRRDPFSGEEGGRLKAHLESCPACAAEARMEERLRSIIVPAELPSPSPGFELSLKARLGIGLEPRTDPIARWGWAAAILTLAVLVLPYVTRITEAALRVVSDLITGLAEVFGRAGSNAEPIIGQLSQLSSPENVMMLNLVLGAIVLLGGIVAVGIAERR